MQTEGKRQLIKHKITWCFIRLRAGFMGTRLKMAYILSPSCGEWTARPGVAGDGGGCRGGRGGMEEGGVVRRGGGFLQLF